MRSNTSPHPDRLFRDRLTRLLGRVRLWALGHGLLRFVATAGLMALAATWAVGGENGPGVFNGWGLSLSLLAACAALGWRFLLQPWRRFRRPAQLAGRIERTADFANLVVAAEEAGRCPERWPARTPVEQELHRRLYARAADVLTLVTPEGILPQRATRTAAVGLGVWAVVGAFLWLSAPNEMARGARRLLWPQPDSQPVATGGLFIAAGPEFAVVGEDLELTGVDFGPRVGAPATAEIRVGRGTWQPILTQPTPRSGGAIGLPDPYRLWTARIENVREDFVWRLRRGPRFSAERTVHVRHYPLLAEMAMTIHPPAYTGLPPRELPRAPAWIEVPAGSRVVLAGRTSHAVVRAALVTGDGDSLALAIDSLVVRGALDIPRDRSFRIQLADSWGLTNESPLTWEIAAATDQAPAVRLERPDDDGILPLSGEVVLLVEAADDYGLAELRLLTRTGASTARDGDGEAWLGGDFWTDGAPSAGAGVWRAVATAAGDLRVRVRRLDADGSSLRTRLQLDLRTDGLNLVAGDGIELVVEAEDNKRPRPANTARSGSLRLMLPSAAEVLLSQEESNENRRDELEEMRRRSRELNSDLDRLTRELMKNPIPDWTRQQEMEAAIDRQRKLQEELARVAAELQRELQNLAESQLTSEAQLRKADEMSQLLQPGASERLQDLLQKMEEGGGQASPEDVARAVEEVARNQQDMARRLDAALAMLKRMAQEQELEGLTALLEQLIQKQQELADLSRELADRRAAEEAAAEAEGQGTELAALDDEQAAEQEGEPAAGNGESEPDPGSQEQDASGEPAGDESDAGEQAGEQGEQGDQQGEQPGDQQEASPSAQQGEGAEPQDEAQDGQSTAEPTAEELARRQEALEQELAQLQAKLEEALENLRRENAENPRDSSEQMAEALEEAIQQMQQQKQQDAMGKASESLQQMDPEEAARMQEQALRDLGSLYSVLLESQQAMQQAMQMEQVGNLRGLAADMLALSAKQELIVQEIPPQLRDLRSNELTRTQHRVQKAAAQVRTGLEQMMEVAPNRVMKLMSQLDDLIETLGYGLRAMGDNRAPVARRHARDGLAAANRIVIGLLTEAQMQGGSGGSGSPQPSMAEKLQQMAREQAGLNGSLEELRRMLADRGISQETRSQMQRLGQQQADLAQRMGDLAEAERERPEGERLLGDLDELGRDMESVGTDISEGLVSEETLVRQERILSRMLDARNSVRRRDYTNRRESETAGELYADQEGEDGRGPRDQDDPFRLRYQPLEQAPMEYRDLVRRYFAALDSLEQLGPDASGGNAGGDVP